MVFTAILKIEKVYGLGAVPPSLEDIAKANGKKKTGQELSQQGFLPNTNWDLLNRCR